MEVSRDSIATGSAPRRKADNAYQHLELADRPGLCKAARSRLPVTVNYFKLNCPGSIKYVTFRLDFEVDNSKTKQREPAKKERMEECFKKAYAQHRTIFPRRDAALVFNGTDMIYCPPDHRITRDYVDFVLVRGAPRRDGTPARDQRARMKITPLGLSQIATVQVDNEQDRCALMQFLDCVLSHEHRFDLTGHAARFIQHGHSLFKIPHTDEEKRLDVKPIGKGEEVWLGLHAAVKCDSDELMLNADTSGSIFKSRNLNLVEFFAQVLRGYTSSLAGLDFDRLMIDDRGRSDLAKALRGTKLMLHLPNGVDRVKKFDRISALPATAEMFIYEGRNISVAEYFMLKYDYRLRCPNLPCLAFVDKQDRSRSSAIPVELFYTLEEPTRFKGKLSDQQLDAFVKAVCMNPIEKKERIERFCVAGGEYLGETATMREWGVSLEREMISIEDCPVLPLPHIEMNASAPQTAVDTETGQWKITETDAKGREVPIPPIELNPDRIVLAIISVNEPQKPGDRECANLLKETLVAYGLTVDPDIGMFSLRILGDDRRATNDEGIDKQILLIKEFCATVEKKHDCKVVPLLVWVFPWRNAPTYGAIKYHTDSVHGVASQCCARKTFEKLKGNAVTNSSAQNLLLKILAKTGSVEFRLSPFQHRNVERLQSAEEPVLIIGIDVSHPGREERMDALKKHETAAGRTGAQANKYRAAHEKLPSARPYGTGHYAGMSYHDCPRSVVSVVGTLDFKGSRYGVSSRVQRLTEEDTVNMVESFRERILDFYNNTGALPKHIIVYRDGVSDSQLKKIAYEELESLESALAKCNIEKDQCTITYITAAKRHHTRFFRGNLEMMDDGMPHLNCPPGTLVEQTIVSRNKWDFYLQSHYGNLGTALPTRYTVARDDWKLSTSFIQTIVFAHCFGNVRCPKPLNIPVPLHYAHLAAKRSKVLFDHYKVNPSLDYIRSTEDLVREEIEKEAVTPHESIVQRKAMFYV